MAASISNSVSVALEEDNVAVRSSRKIVMEKLALPKVNHGFSKFLWLNSAPPFGFAGDNSRGGKGTKGVILSPTFPGIHNFSVWLIAQLASGGTLADPKSE